MVPPPRARASAVPGDDPAVGAALVLVEHRGHAVVGHDQDVRGPVQRRAPRVSVAQARAAETRCRRRSSRSAPRSTRVLVAHEAWRAGELVARRSTTWPARARRRAGPTGRRWRRPARGTTASRCGSSIEPELSTYRSRSSGSRLRLGALGRAPHALHGGHARHHARAGQHASAASRRRPADRRCPTAPAPRAADRSRGARAASGKRHQVRQRRARGNSAWPPRAR